jgi:hypothetical protein
MITYLSDTELNNVQIQTIENRSQTEEYIKERELIWNERIWETEKLGKKVWNGTIYSIDRFVQIDDRNIHIVLNSCEFKDIIFKIKKGIPYIVEKYGISNVAEFITLDCIPITTDGKFVFGLRNNNTNVNSGSIGLIGGTANRDEMEINSISDFSKFMINEIEEETLLKVKQDRLTLFSINQFNGKYEFLYKLYLDIESDKIRKIHKNEEFAKMVCLTAQEVLDYNGLMLDAFKYAKTYILDYEKLKK